MRRRNPLKKRHRSPYSDLDKLRIREGLDRCKVVFHRVIRRSRRKAISLLNDKRLSFPCFYIAVSEIQTYNLEKYLHLNHRLTLNIIKEIKEPDNKNNTDYLSQKDDKVYTVLKWILETGYSEDGIDNDYEEILDIVVSVLMNTYQDKKSMPIVKDMIFNRNIKNHYIHDLVWALFRIHDPQVLKLVAEGIDSQKDENVELAYNLLNINLPDTNVLKNEANHAYESYIQWLEENDPFLFFTEESFQYSSKPIFSTLDLERKYMSKGSKGYEKELLLPDNDFEKTCLESFNVLNKEEKEILSEYSYKLHNKNIHAWAEWLHHPIEEQVQHAMANRRGDWDDTLI